MKKAWIENDTVRDISPGDPDVCYQPDIAIYYSSVVPDDVVKGASLIDGEWINPVISEPIPVEPIVTEPIPVPITVSPVEFKLLWTSAERIAIKGLKNNDPIIEDFYEMLDDPRLDFVNLSLESTQQAVSYLLAKLVEADVVTDMEARKSEILSGTFR